MIVGGFFGTKSLKKQLTHMDNCRRQLTTIVDYKRHSTFMVDSARGTRVPRLTAIVNQLQDIIDRAMTTASRQSTCMVDCDTTINDNNQVIISTVGHQSTNWIQCELNGCQEKTHAKITKGLQGKNVCFVTSHIKCP